MKIEFKGVEEEPVQRIGEIQQHRGARIGRSQRRPQNKSIRRSRFNLEVEIATIVPQVRIRFIVIGDIEPDSRGDLDSQVARFVEDDEKGAKKHGVRASGILPPSPLDSC
jgi:hypothetical protein